MEEIEGKVVNIVYENPKGFKILNIQLNNGKMLIVKGILQSITCSDYIMCTGTYVEHASYGRQFNVSSYIKKEPEQKEQILEYLSSGIIKGVGLKLAQRIIDKFGKESLKVIENSPEELATIDGISLNKAYVISDEYIKQKQFFILLEILKPYNISTEVANDIYLKYGENAITMLNKSPYSLISMANKIKFTEIDKIALSKGIDINDIERLEAAIKYAMNLSVQNGHTYVNKKELLGFVNVLTGAEQTYIDDVLKNMCSENYLYYDKEDDKIQLEGLSIAEEEIALISSKLLNGKIKNIKNVDKKINQLEQELLIELTPGQKDAIKTVTKNGITIITGGPGTGKTTITKVLIELFKNEKLKVEIAAPTGKASKRISEVTKEEAKTIHRLLEISKYEDNMQEAIFKEIKELDCDLLIVDEASMLDTYMLTYILRSIRKNRRLVLIGDINQLPAVGVGKVLEDLIVSKKVPTIYLTQIFRQAQKSNIIVNTHRVNNGENIEIQTDKDKIQDLEIIHVKDSIEMYNEMIRILKNENKSGDILDFFYTSQILTPTKKTNCGTISLNEAIQKECNLSQKIKQYGKIEFKENDRVMQIKNNYDLLWEKGNYSGIGVFNGEMGWIKYIDNITGDIIVEFDDGKIANYKGNLEQLIHAFAITIHKSQGSEFETVILLLPHVISKLMTRNLLYTGMSRAKKKLIIITKENTIEQMIKTLDNTTRNTLLGKALKNI
ncbi:MAG: SF1B family DNA helicase RecD2 [Clostridium sp.]